MSDKSAYGKLSDVQKARVDASVRGNAPAKSAYDRLGAGQKARVDRAVNMPSAGARKPSGQDYSIAAKRVDAAINRTVGQGSVSPEVRLSHIRDTADQVAQKTTVIDPKADKDQIDRQSGSHSGGNPGAQPRDEIGRWV